jgi:hypothetical protein
LISSPEFPQTLEIPYRWAGVDGRVQVAVKTNDDPEALGCPELARGFPYCKAVVESDDAEGYDHIYGWIQMVDADDEPPGFHFDQHPAYENELPFSSSGFLSRFVDAPFADYRDFDFLAHTFLSGKGGKLLEFRKEVRAILGFSWGYAKRGQRIEWFGPDLLSVEDWDGHLEYLTRKYRWRWWRPWRKPWTFAPGFFQHPLDP